jgi:hypothetical protein
MLLSCWLFGLRFVSLIVLTLGAEAGQDQGGAEPLAAFEKEIVDHPLEALAIARRAAGVFGKEETRLYRLAAQQQEKILPSLGLGQVTELAEVLEKKLVDPQTSWQVRIAWLQQRGLGLSPSEVHQLLGSPRSFSLQMLYRRQIEKWVYDQPGRLWLTFIYTNAHTGRLQHVRSASSAER